jgi:hypothetical protein
MSRAVGSICAFLGLCCRYTACLDIMGAISESYDLAVMWVQEQSLFSQTCENTKKNLWEKVQKGQEIQFVFPWSYKVQRAMNLE